ncbi:MAG: TniB family NTP-binding protein [Burkholderiales bacterium]|nr:TniB family NTP-binding protein [Burkholderiales bacterium]
MISRDHLSKQAAKLLEAPLSDKLAFIAQDPPHIDYPASDYILRELQDLVDRPRSIKPECRAVISDSDNGKTTLTRHFMRKNPIVLDEADYPIAKVLWVEAPPTADEGRLYSAILTAMGVSHRADARPERLEAIVHQEMAISQTSVLVIDELHAILNSPAKQHKLFMASLKRLSNMRQLSIVACGTSDVTRALAIDPQFVNRFLRLPLPLWSANEDFVSLVAAFEQLIPLPKPSNLTSPGMVFEIYKGCNGTIGSVRKLIMRAAQVALRTGNDRITFDILTNARKWRQAASLTASPQPSDA